MPKYLDVSTDSPARACARESIELHDSIKAVQPVIRNAFNSDGWVMQAVRDYASLKAQPEEKVANLKRERDAVHREVESLSQEVTVKESERQARSLERELDGLEGELDGPKGKRGVLEQKLASLDASPPP